MDLLNLKKLMEKAVPADINRLEFCHFKVIEQHVGKLLKNSK